MERGRSVRRGAREGEARGVAHRLIKVLGTDRLSGQKNFLCGFFFVNPVVQKCVIHSLIVSLNALAVSLQLL